MASIESALFKILKDDAAVGAICADRISPTFAAQNVASPLVTYDQLSGPRVQSLSGPTGLVEATFEFTCWAEHYIPSRTLADAVRQALDGIDAIVDTIAIDSIQCTDERDIPSEVAGIDVLRKFGKILSFSVWFQETP